MTEDNEGGFTFRFTQVNLRTYTLSAALSAMFCIIV